MIPQNGSVLLDFYADWCGPCKMLTPLVDKITPDMEAKGAKVVKVNIDEHSALAQQYGIRGVPTLVLLRDGSEVGRRSGMMAESALRDFAGA